jgi:signal transduction histidine kinase
MRLFPGKRFHLGFDLALVVLCLVCWVAYRSLQELTRTAERVSRTLEVYQALDVFLVQALEAEVWQQKYCQERTHREDFEQKTRDIPATLRRLRVLIGDDKVLVRSVDQLAGEQAVWLDLLDRQLRRTDQLQALSAPDAAGPEPLDGLLVLTLLAALAEEGRRFPAAADERRAELRHAVARVRNWSSIKARDKEEQTTNVAEITTVVTVLAGFLAVGLALSSRYLVSREIDVRQRAEVALRDALGATEARVRDRTAELADANASLQTLSRELIQAQEAERRRLARELHDEIGQVLTAVKMNLQAVQRADAPKPDGRLSESIGIVERALQQVRNLSLDLRPSLLDDLGLVAALRWYVDRQAGRAGFQGQFTADPGRVDVPPDLATACFRVAQEAVTNVIRHAKARTVHVGLRLTDGELQLTVRDDGAGFDVPQARRRASRGGSLGLLGMQERAQLVGGRMEIDSAPGRGTEVRVRFPVAAFQANGREAHVPS